MPNYSRAIRPHVVQSASAARLAVDRADYAEAWRQLKRAHVLGQSSTILHVRVHALMLSVALEQGDVRAAWGQMFRLAGALLFTAVGLVPEGNTGGSDVSAFRRMPIPADLQRIMESARDSSSH